MKGNLSEVAGILDKYGCLRIIVTQQDRMKYHVKQDELLFVVTGFKIEEPVSWNYIPVLIRRVELYIEWWIKTRNDPDDFNKPQIKNYLKNPLASHNLRPNEFKYFPSLVSKIN